MAVTNGWGQGVINNTNGFGKLATNTINEGAIYENSWSGDTALIGTSAAFAYGKSSYNQGEADPTPTITGTAGGTFNADAGVVFVDTGSFNSSTGQIDLSATSIDSHIITYTVDGVQSGQTVGVTAAPYSSTSSFTFDGVNDYFSAPISALNSATVCSISFWGKKDASNKNLCLGGYNTNNTGIWINWYLDGNIYFSPRGVGTTSFTLTHAQSYDSNWHHYTAVYDGTSAANCKLYLDGNLVATGTGTPPSSLPSNTGDVFQIGALGTAFYTAGNIDEVSIWNTALSSDAITEIYNSGAPSELTSLTNASSSNLKAWYKMGE